MHALVSLVSDDGAHHEWMCHALHQASWHVVQIMASQETARQLSMAGDSAKAQDFIDSGKRKQQELRHQLEAAACCPEHQQVLEWRLA